MVLIDASSDGNNVTTVNGDRSQSSTPTSTTPIPVAVQKTGGRSGRKQFVPVKKTLLATAVDDDDDDEENEEEGMEGIEENGSPLKIGDDAGRQSGSVVNGGDHHLAADSCDNDDDNDSVALEIDDGGLDGDDGDHQDMATDDVTTNAVNHSDNVTPDAGDNNDDVSSQNADDVEAEMASPELSDERDVTQEHVTSRASSRAMSLYEHVDPQDFDARSFFSSVSDLSSRLQSASLTSLDTDFDADEMQSVVSAVSVTMQNFRLYSEHSQQQLERLRTQLHDTKERMHRKIALAPYDPRTGESGLVANLDQHLHVFAMRSSALCFGSV